MQTTWDALASSPEVYVGDPRRGREELDALFGRFGADPRGGTCVEVGCGPGRMTLPLAERFDRVLALDVSPAMVAQARSAAAAAGATNVEFRVVSGERLDGVAAGIGNVLVCYLVLQHLPSKALVLAYLREFARLLAPGGEAFLQVPVLASSRSARGRRLMRSAATPLLARLSRDPARDAAFRGFRLTDGELAAGLDRAGLRVLARLEESTPYRHSHDIFLRCARIEP